MVELKAALEKASSLISELEVQVDTTKKSQIKSDKSNLKSDELIAKYEGLVQGLDTREAKIKHIESIVEAIAKAKKMTAEGRALLKGAEEEQTTLSEGLKTLAKRQAEVEKKLEEGNLVNKKQSDALKKERANFDAKVKAFKGMSAAMK